MGIVYLAYDERLQRRVAIKSLHPGREISEERRARLVREARAAARLNHPAIAQVYDILSHDGRDYIVMEYVEGRTLTSYLKGTPMELAEVVDIGCQIAQGLNAAHSRGIIHRDLKTDNILVTPRGKVKILDFGLAKSFDADSTEVSLTKDGVVMGTSSAMSPEQAKGKRIDPRSDLFSLGSMLYWMTTGTHPFQGKSPLDTMQRVARHRPAPPVKLNKEIPEALSLIIESLLEKDPKRRPDSAVDVALALEEVADLWNTHTTDHGSVSRITSQVRQRRLFRHRAVLTAVGLAAAAAIAAGVLLIANRPRPPRIVAVLAPRVSAVADPDRTAIIAGTARTAVLETIAGLRGLATPATREVDAAGGDPAATARRTGAAELIATSLQERGQTTQIILQRLAGADAKVLWSTAFTVPSDDVSLLADAIRAHLRRAYPKLRARRRGRARAPSPEALTQYLRLRRQMESPPAGVTRKQTLAALDRLREENSSFLLPYLSEAKIARYLFTTEHDNAYQARARELLDRARRLAPDDPRVAAGEASTELAAGNLDSATAAVDRLERLAPGSPDALRYRAALLRKQGKTESAIRLLKKMVATYPSVASLWELAEAELHSGRPDDARRHLGRALQLSPGDRRVRSKLAQLELLNGDPAVAERYYARLAHDYNSATYYSNLGVARLLQGNAQDALKGYRAALAIREDPLDMLSVGDCELVLGRPEEARKSYERALVLAVPLARSDRVKYLGIQGQCLAHLGRAQEAVRAVQEELQLAPNEPLAHFDAALVYAVIGDRTSSIVNAEKAVRLGLNRRWLNLPFFKPLQTDPAFRKLLGA